MAFEFGQVVLEHADLETEKRGEAILTGPNLVLAERVRQQDRVQVPRRHGERRIERDLMRDNDKAVGWRRGRVTSEIVGSNG